MYIRMSNRDYIREAFWDMETNLNLFRHIRDNVETPQGNQTYE